MYTVIAKLWLPYFDNLMVMSAFFGQTKDYKTGIWYFYAKHASTLMNQDNVSEWIDVLFQKASTINNQLIVLV
jgi:hypothetical protein